MFINGSIERKKSVTMKKIYAGTLPSKSGQPISYWTEDEKNLDKERLQARRNPQPILENSEKTRPYNREEIKAYMTQQKLKRHQAVKNEILQKQLKREMMKNDLKKLKQQSNEIAAISASTMPAKFHVDKNCSPFLADERSENPANEAAVVSHAEVAVQCSIQDERKRNFRDAIPSTNKKSNDISELTKKLNRAIQECDEISSISSVSSSSKEKAELTAEKLNKALQESQEVKISSGSRLIRDKTRNTTKKLAKALKECNEASSISSVSQRREKNMNVTIEERILALRNMAQKLSLSLEAEEKRENINCNPVFPTVDLSVDELIAKMTAILPKKKTSNETVRPKHSKSLKETKEEFPHLQTLFIPPIQSYCDKDSRDFWKRNAAAIVIQSNYRGYRVRKVTKNLLRKRTNPKRVIPIGDSLNWNHLRARLQEDMSREIELPRYRIENPNVPEKHKPIVQLVETGNINDYINQPPMPLKSPKSMKPQLRPLKTFFRDPPMDEICKEPSAVDKYEALVDSPPVEDSVDLVSFRVPCDQKLSSSTEPPTKTSTASYDTQVSSTPSNFSMIHSEEPEIEPTIESSDDLSLSQSKEFVPHKHMTFAPKELSNRVHAELMLQKSYDLALNHLKNVENLKNLSVTYDECSKIQTALFHSEAARNEPPHKGKQEMCQQPLQVVESPNTTLVPTEYSMDFEEPSGTIQTAISEQSLESTTVTSCDEVISEATDTSSDDTTIAYDLELKPVSTVSAVTSIETSKSSSRRVRQVTTEVKDTITTDSSESSVVSHRQTTLEISEAIDNSVSTVSEVAETEMQPRTSKSRKSITNSASTVCEVTDLSQETETQPRTSKGRKALTNSASTASQVTEISHETEIQPLVPKIGKGALQSTLSLIDSLQKEEELRFNHQKALFKMQEHLLVEEAKSKLTALQADGSPSLRKKQRAVLVQLRDQRSHIKRLLETQQLAMQQRRLIFSQHQQLLTQGTSKTQSRNQSPVTPSVMNVSLSDTQDSNASVKSPEQSEESPLPISDQANTVRSDSSPKETKTRDITHSTESPVEESFETSTNESQSSCIEEMIPASKHPSEEAALSGYSKDTFEKSSSFDTTPSTDLKSSGEFKVTPESDVTDRRRRRPLLALKMSLSPRPRAHRRYSSESDDSVSLSQTETASDHSDGEGRLVALREELAMRKAEAEKLQKEKRKIRRERLASQKQALQKQIAAYDNYIMQAKLDLEEEARALQVDSTVRPVIKRPLGVTKKVSSPNVSISDKSDASIQTISDSRDATLDRSVRSNEVTEEIPTGSATDCREPNGISSVETSLRESDSDSSSHPTSTETIIQSPRKYESSQQQSQEESQPDPPKWDIFIPDPDHSEDDTTTDAGSDIPMDESTARISTEDQRPSIDQITKDIFESLLRDSIESVTSVWKHKEVKSIVGQVEGHGEVDLNSENLRKSSPRIQEDKHVRAEGKTSDGSIDAFVSLLTDETASLVERSSPTEDKHMPVDANILTSRLLSIQSSGSESYFSDDKVEEDFNVHCHHGVIDDTFWASGNSQEQTDEAEASRMKEIQELKEKYPDLVLREVPNKPPPPYTPPKSVAPPQTPTTPNVAVAKVVQTAEVQPAVFSQPQVTNKIQVPYQLSRMGYQQLASEVTHSIPHKQAEVMNIIQRYTSFIYKQWMNGTQPVEVQSLGQFGIILNESGIPEMEMNRRIFHVLLFDLSKQLLQSINDHQNLLRQPKPVWLSPRFETSDRRFVGVSVQSEQSVCGFVERQSRVILGYEPRLQRESTLSKWAQKRRDQVDKILVQEAIAEEPSWTQYQIPEDSVKTKVSDEIFNTLIEETVQIFEQIMSEKLSRMSTQ